MTRADELKHMLSPARHPGESFKRYKARRAGANDAVKRQLKGRIAHTSTQVAVIPEPQWNDEHIKAVASGKLIVTGTIVLPGGKTARLVRSKGITYRKAA